MIIKGSVRLPIHFVFTNKSGRFKCKKIPVVNLYAICGFVISTIILSLFVKKATGKQNFNNKHVENDKKTVAFIG